MDPLLARLDELERRVALLEHAPWAALGRAAVPKPLRRGRRVEPAPTCDRPLSEDPSAEDGAAPRGASVQAAGTGPDATPRPQADPALAAPVPHRATLLKAPVAPPTPARDLESWLGTVVLGRVGIAAVVLAAAYFAQLAYRSVGDVLKVLSLYGWSAALIAAGALLRRRVPARYVGLLWGGGVAVAYLAALAATLRYGLVAPTVGLGLLLGAAALGQALARLLRAEVLATVSIGGALAAPVLLSLVFQHGVLVLVYAALVHAWAARAEHAWGWRSARVLALAGATALGALCGLGQALSSPPLRFAALHAFALTLVLPDLLASRRGDGPARGYRFYAGATLGLLALALALSEPGVGSGLRGGTALAGALWLALALWVGSARGEASTRYAATLAAVGGATLALGAAIAWPGEHLAFGAYGSLALLAPALLALRPRVRSGDGPALPAAALALLTALADALWLTQAAAPARAAPAILAALALALAPGLAVRLSGRTPGARALGQGLAVATLGGVLLVAGLRGPHAWIAAALAAPALLSLLSHAHALRRQDAPVARSAEALLLLLAAGWIAGALPLPRPGGWPAGLDAHTLAALGLAGALATARSRRAGAPAALGALLVAAVVALLVLAGWREVALLTRTLEPGARDAARALYPGVAGALLALHAGWLRRAPARFADAAEAYARPGRAGAALALLGLMALLVLEHAARAHSAGVLVGELLGGALLALATSLPLTQGGARRPAWRHGALAPLLVLALAWLVATGDQRFPLSAPWWNLRFLSGAGLCAALCAFGRSARRAEAPRAVTAVASTAAASVLFLAGLFEVLRVSADLPGAWGPVLVSLYVTLTSAALLTVGFVRRIRPARVAALAGFGVVVAKVGLYDLSATSLPLRVLVTGLLGLVLLGSAYAYARNTRSA